MVANHVSHANNKTKRRQLPNLQTKRIYVEELGRFVRLRICLRSLRTLDKIGLSAYLRKHNMKARELV